MSVERGPILVNCDLGESAGAMASGRDDELAARCDIINIACGGHAGDEQSMRHFVALAGRLGIGAGAHPSFPDRDGFGRRRLAISESALVAALGEQLGGLALIAESLGVEVASIKPHGALYHAVGEDVGVARAFLEACERRLPRALLILQAGASTLGFFAGQRVRVLREAFADRLYEVDGSLRDRRLPGALIEEPGEIAAHVRGLLATVEFDTLCVHSDTPNAVEAVAAARDALIGAGRGFDRR